MSKIGIYNPYLITRGGGERVCLTLAETLAKQHNTTVYIISHGKLNLKELGIYFNIDTSKLKTVIIKMDKMTDKLVHRLPIPGRLKNLYFDVRAGRVIKKQKFDLFINNCIHSNLPNPCKKGVYMCMFPQKISASRKKEGLAKVFYHWIVNIMNYILLHPGKKRPIQTYDFITANSVYTQGFINKFWGMESVILYPICEDMKLPKSGTKKKMILNSGRFFENSGENHHKKQDMLLDTFAEMTDLHRDGWELHFSGTVAEDVGGLKYILKLMKKAQGLPVYFHFSCPFSEMRQLFNDATIYWHATGFGSNKDKHPEKQEHFGITTVEAMSTGSIPIVINSAGQKESVVHEQNGFLWNTKKELQDYTRKVTKMEASQLKALQKSAIETSKRFDRSAFEDQVKTIYSKLI